MNTLYPIIRRKRRPLIVADAKPVEPVKVDPAPPVKPETKTEPPKHNDETTPEQNTGQAASVFLAAFGLVCIDAATTAAVTFAAAPGSGAAGSR